MPPPLICNTLHFLFFPSLKILKMHVVLVPQVIRILAVADILLGIRVEALRVAGEADGREDGAPVPAVVDGVPVDAAEKGVLFYAPRAPLHVAEPLGPVHVAEGPDDVLGLGRDGRLLWEDDGLLDDPVGKEREEGGPSSVSCLLCARSKVQLTVYISQWGSGARTADTPSGTRISEFQGPTSPPRSCGPCYV